MLIKMTTLAFLISTCVALAAPKDLRPFTTDGCSGFPETLLENGEAILKCCVIHDVQYWAGGLEIERKDADNALEACVKKAHPGVLGLIMYGGVRPGGSPLLPLPWKWGYGWPKELKRAYLPIRKDDCDEAYALLSVSAEARDMKIAACEKFEGF